MGDKLGEGLAREDNIGGLDEGGGATKRDAQSGRLDHGDVIGAVADGDRLIGANALCARYVFQMVRFLLLADDVSENPAGQYFTVDLEPICPHSRDGEAGDECVDEVMEAA